MKPFIIFLLASFLVTAGYSQDSSVYKLPDTFNFDYTLIQRASGRKPDENKVYHFYFTKSGEYAAAEWSRDESKKGNLLIVLTKAGNILVFNNREKNVTILNPHKLIADMMGILRWVRVDSLMAHLRSKSDSSDFHSAKSGRTKAFNNYTATEYTVTRHRHKGSVWIANVDFPAISDYFKDLMRTGMMSMRKGPMEERMGTNPLMQALMQPKTLITEIEMSDSTGDRSFNLQTLSLQSTPTSVTSKGFAVSDYSNMTLREIFEAEMKRRNN